MIRFRVETVRGLFENMMSWGDIEARGPVRVRARSRETEPIFERHLLSLHLNYLAKGTRIIAWAEWRIVDESRSTEST